MRQIQDKNAINARQRKNFGFNNPSKSPNPSLISLL